MKQDIQGWIKIGLTIAIIVATVVASHCQLEGKLNVLANDIAHLKEDIQRLEYKLQATPPPQVAHR